MKMIHFLQRQNSLLVHAAYVRVGECAPQLTDETNTIEYLANLLMADLHIKLEPFEDGRSAPKPKGATAKRMYALALQQRQSEQTADGVQQLTVAYTEGALSLVQVWDVRGPQWVSQDWRHGERFMIKPSTSSPASARSTCLGMMFVDAYYAYLYLNKLKIEDLPFRTAMRRMAYALMHNNLEEGTKDSDDLFNIDAVVLRLQKGQASKKAERHTCLDEHRRDPKAHPPVFTHVKTPPASKSKRANPSRRARRVAVSDDEDEAVRVMMLLFTQDEL
ncbi:MAG: hypothetical protein SGPRY_004579 [Prymnesium sp.]